MQNFTFFEAPKFFFLFLFSPVDLFNWKKSLWAAFFTIGPARRRPRPIYTCEAGPCHLLPRDAAKWAPVPRGPHLPASLLCGRETATHPTRYRACYSSNPSPSSAATPSVVDGQIPVDGPVTRHHPPSQGCPRVRLSP
jgi:hypothetical protein